ncbi:MAG TPA: hypothetical protein VJP07_09905 [Dehalococcoidia bacterium]|nr:hypothetical protein [Dehalococcoidia bacterium]
MDACSCPTEAGATTCERASAPATIRACPACGKPGKRVEQRTLKGLLAVPLTQLRDVEYRFCRTPDCAVVYFSVDGAQRFDEDAVRERVFQKHPADDDALVCYCFRHTVGSIRSRHDVPAGGSVIAEIQAGIQAGQCACDIRNPQGSCCLGNVRSVADSTRGS